MHIKHKLINLIDKLEESIKENSCDVWMHDLSDTTSTSFVHPTNYHHMDSEGEVEIIEYEGVYKDFIALKEAIYNLEKERQVK